MSRNSGLVERDAADSARVEPTRVRGGSAVTSSPGTARKRQARVAYVLVAPYTLLLLGFGIGPAGYAVYLSFVRPEGGFAFFDNFVTVASDFRYAATFAHVGTYALIYLVPSLAIAIGMSILLRPRARRSVAVLQLLYYLPQGLIGAAGVVVWMFMLTPNVSPVGAVLQGLGYENLVQVVIGGNLPVVLAVIAVWTSGNTILLMYAALTSIPDELYEAARLDGANALQQARYVTLPMLRKWIAYTTILNSAACVELFAEPTLMNSATGVGANWSPMQLALTFAYQYQNFPAAAALSVQILVILILAAVVVVKWTGMFKIEE